MSGKRLRVLPPNAANLLVGAVWMRSAPRGAYGSVDVELVAWVDGGFVHESFALAMHGSVDVVQVVLHACAW